MDLVLLDRRVIDPLLDFKILVRYIRSHIKRNKHIGRKVLDGFEERGKCLVDAFKTGVASCLDTPCLVFVKDFRLYLVQEQLIPAPFLPEELLERSDCKPRIIPCRIGYLMLVVSLTVVVKRILDKFGFLDFLLPRHKVAFEHLHHYRIGKFTVILLYLLVYLLLFFLQPCIEPTGLLVQCPVRRPLDHLPGLIPPVFRNFNVRTFLCIPPVNEIPKVNDTVAVLLRTVLEIETT